MELSKASRNITGRLHIWMTRKYFVICMLLDLFAATAIGHCESGVTANGLLSFQMFAAKNVLVRSMYSTNTFRASLSTDGRWALEVHPLYNTNDVMYKKNETIYLTFDGVDTYFAHYTEAVKGMVQGRPATIGTQPLETRGHEAYISSGSYPFAPGEQQKRVHMLWLIFGAGRYIRDSSIETMPLPWVAARWSLLSYGFRIGSVLSDDPPYVPRQLKFIRSKQLDRTDTTDEWSRSELNNPLGDEEYRYGMKDLNQRLEDFNEGGCSRQRKNR